MDGTKRDGVEREGGVAESNCRDLNCASLCFTVAVSIAHMIEKWSEKGKGTEKWNKIHVIVKGKMSLSRVAVSQYTSVRERMKCEGKSIVRYSRRDN